MKDDERELLKAVLAGENPRAAWNRLGIPCKRALRFFEDKWARFYNYGVSADLGWIEDRAKAEEYLSRK